MKKPWLKKNPLMSLWLTGANAIIGKARSATNAETSRQRMSATRQAARFWVDAWFAALKPKRHR